MDIQNDQFHRVPKGDIQQCPYRIAKPHGDALGGVSEKTCQWDDGDGIHRKDDGGIQMRVLCRDADGNENEENVYITVRQGVLRVTQKPATAPFHADQDWRLARRRRII